MKTKTFTSLLTALSIVFTLCFLPHPISAKSIVLKENQTRTVTVKKDRSITLKVGSGKNKAKWSVKSGKKYIRLSSKKKSSVKVRGIQKGTAKIQCKIGKKKWFCKVKVTAARKPEKPESSSTPVNTPAGSPTPTNDPGKDASGKNRSDVTVLKTLIAEQISRGAALTEDIDSDSYRWDRDGSLISINWDYKNLSGDISFAGLPSLVSLKCGGNELTNLDISQNLTLRQLDCYNNPFASLNVANNKNLEVLNAAGTSITELNITGNARLKQLSCPNTKLQYLDISQNPLLEQITAYRCQLENLDTTSNPNLISIDLTDNPLSVIDLSQNVRLESLYVSGCQFCTMAPI